MDDQEVVLLATERHAEKSPSILTKEELRAALK
jgi:hypothetical protein